MPETERPQDLDSPACHAACCTLVLPAAFALPGRAAGDVSRLAGSGGSAAAQGPPTQVLVVSTQAGSVALYALPDLTPLARWPLHAGLPIADSALGAPLAVARALPLPQPGFVAGASAGAGVGAGGGGQHANAQQQARGGVQQAAGARRTGAGTGTALAQQVRPSSPAPSQAQVPVATRSSVGGASSGTVAGVALAPAPPAPPALQVARAGAAALRGSVLVTAGVDGCVHVVRLAPLLHGPLPTGSGTAVAKPPPSPGCAAAAAAPRTSLPGANGRPNISVCMAWSALMLGDRRVGELCRRQTPLCRPQP
jgi:hypothetical protein